MNQEPTLHERLAHEQSEVRAAALAELLQSGADPLPHLDAVADCLGDPSELLRMMALILLGQIGAPASGYLAAALGPKQPDSFRAVASAIIAGIGPPAASSVQDLCRCLTSDDETLRNAAALALAKIGEASVPSLRRLLQFPNPETVAKALGALAMIGTPAAAAAPDIDALTHKLPRQTQLECAAALACLTGDPGRSLAVLAKSMEDPDPSLRKTAIEKIALLGEIGHPAIPSLLRCTLDPDENVRVAAVLALGRIQAPPSQVLPGIASRLGDPAAEVRFAAAVVMAGYGSNARPHLGILQECLHDPVEKVANCVEGAIRKIESSSP